MTPSAPRTLDWLPVSTAAAPPPQHLGDLLHPLQLQLGFAGHAADLYLKYKENKTGSTESLHPLPAVGAGGWHHLRHGDVASSNYFRAKCLSPSQ